MQRACKSVGIDLGTTYSAIAYMTPQLIPQIVMTETGESVIPSVIYFDEDDEIIVGETALQQAEVDADRVAQFVKVHMGDEWRREFNGHVYTPESLSAIILSYLAKQAAMQFGGDDEVTSAVITVPAFFTEKRRRATQQAGEIAGLDVIGTLNEPMAATLAYGLHQQGNDQNVVVYDLGGGTFDVTVVRISPKEIAELATTGNRQLGGKDWDKRLINFAAEDFLRAHGDDPRQDSQGAQDLQLACEKAKRQLSQKKKTLIKFQAHNKAHSVEVTRKQFEELTADLLVSTRLTTELALDDAKLSWNDISRVVLVGGSTQMPAIRKMLEEVAGKPPDRGVNPVLAVALGASIYAHLLETGDAPQTVHLKSNVPPVRFVTAHGVGVGTKDPATMNWKNVVLIPKNSPVPATKTKRFSAGEEVTPSTSIRIPITQGDTFDFDLAEQLGEGVISGFPGNEPAGQPVDVTLEFDETGRLHAHAVYVNTGLKMDATINVDGILKPEEVEDQKKYLHDIGFLKLYPSDDDDDNDDDNDDDDNDDDNDDDDNDQGDDTRGPTATAG